MKTQIINPVTPEQYQKLLERAQHEIGNGVYEHGGDGGFDEHGVEVRWSYLNPNLAIEVIKKPFFVSESVLHDKLTEWLKA